MQEIMIRPGVGVMHGRVNAGFVAGADGIVVIDTMYSPADGRDIAAFARRHSQAPFRAVVNTHHHADHTFGNQAFGAPVVASEDCRRRMLEALGTAWSGPELKGLRETIGERLDGLEIVIPSITFAVGLCLYVGPINGHGAHGRVEVQLAGGHTPGSSTVYLPHEGVLFAGDMFFVGRYPFMRHSTTAAWIAALERVKQLGPTTLVPGHGPVCDAQGTIREADRMIGYFRETKDQLKAMLAEGLDRDGILARAAEFPRAADEGYERMHGVNLGFMFDELLAGTRPDQA